MSGQACSLFFSFFFWTDGVGVGDGCGTASDVWLLFLLAALHVNVLPVFFCFRDSIERKKWKMGKPVEPESGSILVEPVAGMPQLSMHSQRAGHSRWGGGGELVFQVTAEMRLFNGEP